MQKARALPAEHKDAENPVCLAVPESQLHRHRLCQSGMIFYPRGRCSIGGCLSVAGWGAAAAAAPRRCAAHRLPADKHLSKVCCASCGLEITLDARGLCEYCDEAGELKRAHLENHQRVADRLFAEFGVESCGLVLDGDGCERRRPVFVIEGLHRKIVVEVGKHRQGLDTVRLGGDHYIADELSSEYRRMHNIADEFGAHTTFVRYNPDAYMGRDGTIKDPPRGEREDQLVGWIKTLRARGRGVGFASELCIYYDSCSDG